MQFEQKSEPHELHSHGLLTTLLHREHRKSGFIGFWNIDLGNPVFLYFVLLTFFNFYFIFYFRDF